MKYLIALIFTLPTFVYAHCPVEFTVDGSKYCTQVKWLTGSQKIQNQFVESDTASPYLVPSGEIPQKWIYSHVQFPIWKKGDSTHAPQILENFRIFPYMVMENGHHHSTSYNFYYDETEQAYTLDQVAFQTMKGCWSLRWTTAHGENLNTSEHLINVTPYSNLNTEEMADLDDYCKNISPQEQPGNSGGGHHHH